MKSGLAALGFALLVSVAPARTASADPPRDFLHDAIQGDNSEIMLGYFGERRAASPGVRRFAHTLARDHSKAKWQAAQLARRRGFYVPDEVTQEAREERQRLRYMHGHQFDREYVRYMIDDHRKDIDKFREEANERDGEVGQLARMQLPTLRKHLDMALELDRNGERLTWR